jgi:hypothetical protein
MNRIFKLVFRISYLYILRAFFIEHSPYLFLIPIQNYSFSKELTVNIILQGYGLIPVVVIPGQEKVHWMLAIVDCMKKWE